MPSQAIISGRLRTRSTMTPATTPTVGKARNWSASSAPTSPGPACRSWMATVGSARMVTWVPIRLTVCPDHSFRKSPWRQSGPRKNPTTVPIEPCVGLAGKGRARPLSGASSGLVCGRRGGSARRGGAQPAADEVDLAGQRLHDVLDHRQAVGLGPDVQRVLLAQLLEASGIALDLAQRAAGVAAAGLDQDRHPEPLHMRDRRPLA